MQCACEIDSSCGENGPDFFTEAEPVAIKEHKCGECGRIIKPGEKYRRESGIWESGWETYKTCMDCASIRDVYFCSYYYGQVLCDLHGHFEEIIYSEHEVVDGNINQLTPGGKQIVFGIIEEIWAEMDEEAAAEAEELAGAGQ